MRRAPEYEADRLSSIAALYPRSLTRQWTYYRACTSDTADRASEINPHRLNEIHDVCMGDPRQLRLMYYILVGLDLQLLTTHIQLKLTELPPVQYSAAQTLGPLKQADAYNSRANRRTNNKPNKPNKQPAASGVYRCSKKYSILRPFMLSRSQFSDKILTP